MVLVDNATYSFGFQIDNGIPIIPFYDSKKDEELISLADYLRKLANETDVRQMNRNHFKFRTIAESKSPENSFDRVIKEKHQEFYG